MFNQFTGVGRLAGDPELKTVGAGTQLANFTLCCDYGWGDNKGTEFIRVTVFGKLAGICGDYLKKGSMCLIQGEVITKKWTDQNGNDRYSTGVTANTMKMLSPKSENQGSGHQEPPSQNTNTGDDTPF